MKNRQIVIWIIVIIVVVAAGVLIYHYHKKQSTVAMQQNDNGNPATVTQPSATPTVTPTGTANLAYDTAVQTYKERFQFKTCQLGTPAVLAVRSGTPVMIDNRDSVAHTFGVDSQTYHIAAYNYAVVYPSTITNKPVTCDGKNSVTLNVEK